MRSSWLVATLHCHQCCSCLVMQLMPDRLQCCYFFGSGHGVTHAPAAGTAGDCLPLHPADVYTSLPPLLPWIKQTIQELAA